MNKIEPIYDFIHRTIKSYKIDYNVINYLQYLIEESGKANFGKGKRDFWKIQINDAIVYYSKGSTHIEATKRHLDLLITYLNNDLSSNHEAELLKFTDYDLWL